MMAKQLTSEQYIAIEWLAKPRKGGKTYEEIAQMCGVTARTLENWRKDATFDAEFKRAIVRDNSAKLPELIDSLSTIAMRDGNAAMAKLALQVSGMLTDRIEVDTKDNAGTDVEALRARLEALKLRKDGESETAE
ncbi:phBC6A51 family helix-turn-helix protein [Paenibacillus tuaregi]|uniref:phBC6A51 family helix-turn-helix protein n=1 Tax=Paenibacillus tuaregi TaxID=1816681 RepID=UPI0008388FF4|nr:helix-turn-helix domain-containing protein [Paenibacillus tuaregi]